MADSNIKRLFNSTKYYAYIWDSKHHTGTTGVGQWSTGVSCVNTSLC